MTAAATPSSLVTDLVRAQRRDLAALVGWVVVQALPSLVAGVAVARAIDDGFLAGRTSVGLGWLAAFAASSLVGAVATQRSYLRLGAIVEPVRDEVVRRVVVGSLRRSTQSGRPPDTGAIARLTQHSEVVRDTLAGVVMTTVEFPIAIVAALAGLATLAPIVLWFVVPPLLLALALLLATAGALGRWQRQILLADEQLAEDTARHVGGIRDVTACGAEDASMERLDRSVAAQVAAATAIARIAAVRGAALGVGSWLSVGAMVVATPWLVDRGLTAGEVVGAVTYLVHGLHGAVGTLVGGLTGSGTRLVAVLRRVDETYGEVDETGGDTAEPAADGGPPPPTHPSRTDLVLRRVTFAYGPHSEPLLRDLDLEVAAGDHLAVVGPSGIGKSTLAALAAGMLRPQRGDVCIGGVPAHRVATDLRVLIPQQAYVFVGTLGENLRYLQPAATVDDLDHAADAVGLRPLVERLGGYDGVVVPSGLTAADQQLVALARSYLAPAPLVILDEATCHLDPAAEAVAERAFLDRGGTLVVIAHRISSALRARRVLVLDGDDARSGTHPMLLETSPLYRDLVGHWHTGGAPAPVARPQGDRAVPSMLEK
jgi:ATP-binding cassette subfamily C protein